MILGEVVGNIVSTNKDESLLGYKLLVVRPLNNYKCNEDIVAIDRVGAGINSQVIVAKGEAARLGLLKNNVCIDAAIIAIVD
ncbi:MAG: EutN/CcmL family microcompartment protein [Sarcina sp.]